MTEIYVAAPSSALTWHSPAERNRLLKTWRGAVLATFGEQSRCIRLAWVLADSFNAKLGYAFPTNSWLARETLIAENKVKATLSVLEQGGAIVRAWVVRPNGQKQRAIYPARALMPVPTVGTLGGPQQPGTHNLRRIRLPKSELERAALAARARERNAQAPDPAAPPHGHPSEDDRSESEPATEGEPAAPIPFPTRTRRHRA